MSKRPLALLIIAVTVAAAIGCLLAVAALTFSSYGDFFGQAPAETPTPTKTFVPTFTSTPMVVPSPTDTRSPTSEPMPTAPPETPIPTQPPTPTLGPPTNTPVPPPPAPTRTPRPPTPTNTPEPTYDYEMVQLPQKDFCHPGYCLPEISGDVIDAQGNPLERYAVTIKLESEVFGVEYCAAGDAQKMMQPGQFKFGSPDGRVFGDYTLTVVRSQGDPSPLSITYQLGGRAAGKGQHTGIIFRRKY